MLYSSVTLTLASVIALFIVFPAVAGPKPKTDDGPGGRTSGGSRLTDVDKTLKL